MLEIQKEIVRKGGKFSRYQSLILGEKKFFKLFRYELIMVTTNWMPGALGLLLRGTLYKKLLGRVGKNVSFGTGVVLRHPQKIKIGDNVIIDDGCVLDAKGKDNKGICICDGVFLGRNSILNCQNGDIILEQNVNIGSNCTIFSASSVRVRADNLIAAYCYLVGGTHRFDDPSIPVLNQGRESRGITVGPGGWLGAHVTVFDGVQIGKHVVIGAGSIVNRDLPDFAIAAGVPAKILKKRRPPKTGRRRDSVSVGIVNFNGSHVLGDTLKSVLKQDYPELREIIVADDGSTDGSVDYIKRHFPNVRILELGKNLGPNAARNAILKEAASNHVLLMDNDIALNPDVISLLEEALEARPDAGIAGAQIRFFDQPDRVQYNGVYIHYVGGAVMNSLDLDCPVEVGAVSGGTLLVRRNRAFEIGLFDEDFFSGWEDGDFTFRMTLAGFPCLQVSKALVFHKKAKTGFVRMEWQVRNRWWFLLKNLGWRTLIVISQALLVNQVMIFGFMLVKKQGGSYIRGMWQVVRSLPATWRKRRFVQKIKTVKDRRVLTGRGINLWGDLPGSSLFRFIAMVLNGFYSLYWRIIRGLTS